MVCTAWLWGLGSVYLLGFSYFLASLDIVFSGLWVMYFLIVLGLAGSGKSTLAGAFKDWLESHQMDSIVVNLDPAVEDLVYVPDVDVRGYVNAWDVMRRYRLGPNGALITSIDLMANHLDKLKESIDRSEANYVIIDTPGQMEVFAFRAVGPLILSSLIADRKAVSLFLIDIHMARQPLSFASSIFLSLSAWLRLRIPQVIVISKTDMYPEEDVEKVLSWADDPFYLLSEIRSMGDPVAPYESFAESLESYLQSTEVVPISSATWSNLDGLYASIQRVLAGGEDYLTEEPSSRL